MVKKAVEILATVCLLVLILAAYQYRRPLPIVEPQVTLKQPQLPKPADQLWPPYGQAAIGAQGYGVLASYNTEKAVPMASVAKIVTALTVLKTKPLAKGEPGPTITITAEDVATFNDYYGRGGAVAKVSLGGQISQYQALEAMLLPSANNYADTVARWAFGSLDAYILAANQTAADLGMTHTKITSANGFAPDTTSTADDLVKLGQAALANEVVAEIVRQPSANLPMAGAANNTNWLLGSDGVIGIKTGSSDQAGGCFLFASNRSIDRESVTVIGAIMGAGDRNQAISDSQKMLQNVDQSFSKIALLKKGESIGYYNLPWTKAEMVLAEDLSILAFKGGSLKFDQNLSPATIPSKVGDKVGELSITQGQQTKKAKVVLKDSIDRPSLQWRIFR